MGKDWHWGSGANSRSSNSKRTAAAAEKDSTTTATASGCMSAVFQFFDFHHFQFPLNHHHHNAAAAYSSSFNPTSSFLPDEDHHHHTILKGLSGVEAPRNSLELEEPPPLSSHSTTTSLKEEENLNISMGIIQIKTRTSCSSCSEISSSPGGAKTPNLVARLMGLDLLPNEPQSPSSYSSSHETPTKSNLHHHHHLKPRQQLPHHHHGKLIISHRHSVDVDITTAGGAGRSLPETPRISSGRRSDVDLHHLLSLQINKENNISVGEELELSRLSTCLRKNNKELKQEDYECRSRSQYARQIMKQVKESVSRKVGHDITNTVRNRGAEQGRDQRDDELVVSQLKIKKSSRVFNKVADQSSPGKQHSTTPSSCSPRLSRFLEPKQKITTTNTCFKDKSSSTTSQPQAININVIQPQTITVLTSKPKFQLAQQQEKNQQHMFNEKRPAKKGKRSAGDEKFSSRLKKPPQTTDIIRNKQEDSFVRPSAATASRSIHPHKKCKRTPLSNDDVLNITVPTRLPVKKLPPPPPATKLPKKEVLSAQRSKRGSQQLSSNTCLTTYKQEATPLPVVQCNINEGPNIATTGTTTTTTTTTTTAEYDYITRMLKRAGIINKDTQVSLFTEWFSPSHPLDPNIFHHLEDTNPITISGQLSHYCNRKLIFELVDEILVRIIMKPWVGIFILGRDYYYGHMQGSAAALIDMLCEQVIRRSSYDPCLDYHHQVREFEDIDGLIDRDLTRMIKMQKRIAFEEEGERVVMEIEKDILETLIHETAVELKQSSCIKQREKDR